MVAPSFQSFTQLSALFIKGAKFYVRVRNEKTGTEREVRWYSDKEFTRLYSKKIEAEVEGKKEPGDGIDAPWEFYWKKEGHKNLKKVWGFEKGPLLVFRGLRNQDDEDWCRLSIARYAVGIGWYIRAVDTLPENVPNHFKMLLLSWDEFRDGDEVHSKRPSQLMKILEEKEKKNQFIVFKNKNN